MADKPLKWGGGGVMWGRTLISMLGGGGVEVNTLRTIPPPPFDGAIPLQGPLEGEDPENIDFFVPKWHQMALASLVAISGPQTVSIFMAHLFQWPWLWNLPASESLRPASYKQQVH
jgi:hypothetical protein